MSLKITKYFNDSILLIENKRYSDNRGYFSEIYNKEIFNKFPINVEFVQDNISFSRNEGTLRGLHFQNPPFAQSKLVQVTRGMILDVIVDIRKNSKTYGKYLKFEISNENFKQLFIPEGFAHGFCTLVKNTEVFYKASNYYSPENEQIINFNDKNLSIDWNINIQDAILSNKDLKGISFNELQSPF